MALHWQGSVIEQWLSNRPRPSSYLFGFTAVEVRSSGRNRGLGLFTTHLIPAFSPVLIEPPMILMRPSDDLPELYTQFLDLQVENQRSYLSLSFREHPDRDAALEQKLLSPRFSSAFSEEEARLMVKIANVMQTNAFNVDMQDGRGPNHRALFATIARINHSCAPNAHVCFYPPEETSLTGRMYVSALRNLDPGEEVLISYFNILLPRSERRTKAKKWGFQCECPVCNVDLEMQASLEKNRRDISKFMSTHGKVRFEKTFQHEQARKMFETGKALALMVSVDSTLFPALPDLYDALAELEAKDHVSNGNVKNKQTVMTMLEMGTAWEAKITGPKSPATRRRLTKVQQRCPGIKAELIPNDQMNGSGDYTVTWSNR